MLHTAAPAPVPTEEPSPDPSQLPCTLENPCPYPPENVAAPTPRRATQLKAQRPLRQQQQQGRQVGDGGGYYDTVRKEQQQRRQQQQGQALSWVTGTIDGEGYQQQQPPSPLDVARALRQYSEEGIIPSPAPQQQEEAAEEAAEEAEEAMPFPSPAPGVVPSPGPGMLPSPAPQSELKALQQSVGSCYGWCANAYNTRPRDVSAARARDLAATSSPSPLRPAWPAPRMTSAAFAPPLTTRRLGSLSRCALRSGPTRSARSAASAPTCSSACARTGGSSTRTTSPTS